MLARHRRIRQLELCNPNMFGDLVLTCQTPTKMPIPQPRQYVTSTNTSSTPDTVRRASTNIGEVKKENAEADKRRASALVEQLLFDIYANIDGSVDYNSVHSSKSRTHFCIETEELYKKDIRDLYFLIDCLKEQVIYHGRGRLLRQLKRRDALRRQREARCDVITNHLRKLAPENSDMRFALQPAPGESGFSQWATAMKMVAQLPEGIPPEFRRRLWLQLAERHLTSKGVDWGSVERDCFSEWSHPADAELGVQIVKDLHRTGCSLFCGEDGQENQVLLKRVLLAYARWNKSVGYCQGFNMLAALILQVTEKNESDALKLMIYLIEGVLPDSYFADSLRGLSVDMAVFRELLKMRLPRLSRHLDALQTAAKDGATSYEPPLTNVFTMQWFLTLFCNCLPQPTVLRVWDLILLEGNEILLRTALAIWQTLAERIMSVRSADEFYCIMGVLTRELLEFGLLDANSLIKAVVKIGSLSELKVLREHYLYNINPWGSSIASSLDPSYTENEEKQLRLYHKERLMLDISALKKQYAKLKQRQKQAHIIFSAAVSRQTPPSTPVAMNHLLLGKSALVPARRIAPNKGAIPPPRQITSSAKQKEMPRSPSSSSSDTELCDEPGDISSDEDVEDINSQFVEDMPAVPSDMNLMNTDNICENSATKIESADDDILNKFFDSQIIDSSNQSASDIFDSAIKCDYSLERSENTDDESFDFDKFLEERVRCMKKINVSSENSEDVLSDEERMECARRNSQKALEIIQENSLILHRILQCQSRLTPSPPSTQDFIAENKSPADIPDRKSLFLKNEDEEDTFLNVTQLRRNTASIPNEILEPEKTYVTERLKPETVIPELLTPQVVDRGGGIDQYLLRDDALSFNFSEQRKIEIPAQENVFDTCTREIQLNEIIEAVEPVSKFESIFQYGKDLDERYKNLILNSNFSNKQFSVIQSDEPESLSLTSGSAAESTINTPVSGSFLFNLASTSPVDKISVGASSSDILISDRHSTPSPTAIPPASITREERSSRYLENLVFEEPSEFSNDQLPSSSYRSYMVPHEKFINPNPATTESHTGYISYGRKSPSQIKDNLPEFIEVSSGVTYNPSPFNYSCKAKETEQSSTSPSATYCPALEIKSSALPALNENNSSNIDKFGSSILPPEEYRSTRWSSSAELQVKSISSEPNGHLKSPSRVYNPFPVQVTSRQKKDVPVRLGLYKK